MNRPAVVIRFARGAVIVALFIVAAAAGTLSGVLFAYGGDLPEISALDDYAPSTITRVYAADGSPIGDFAVQRRLVIGYDDIPPVFREAIIASEDAGFDSHFGLSISAIAFRLTRDVLEAAESVVTGRPSRPAGASTLTQQLARNMFPQTVGFQLGDMSIERKIKEAIVAMQIEKRFTKREILTFYANQMLFGHGTYGVEAAARLYFGKSAKDLTLEEAALLAGIVQLPARQSPYVNMEAAKRRRAYVLQRMADERYITQAEADAAKERPIVTHGQPTQPPGIAPYFVEEIRQHLEDAFGAKALYESGLSVTTTLDVRLQRAANEAVENGLRRYDKRRGVYRRPRRNVLAEGHSVEGFADDRWNRPIAQNDVVPAIVVTAPKTGPAQVRVGRHATELARDGFAWTRRTSAAELFKAGDLIDVRVTKFDQNGGIAAVSLEQTPLAEAALVAIDNRSGQIKAMVGGWSFARSKFNRAVQAYRQLGSTFKPVVYTAAIDRGFTPASMIVDEPIAFPAGPNQPDYAPQNYDHTFEGPVTLRHALEDSRNIPAVKMMAELDPKNVLEYAKRFGFDENFPPFLSMALGAGDGTLLQVTSAFSVFPNRGVRMRPFDLITVKDRDGNLLEENRSEPIGVIRADTAFVMTNILRGVVQPGAGRTGAAAASLNWPIAGKTGTVDDNTDAWFVGFDPDITVGVWVGLDEKKPLGANETGAVAALPIWMDFMRAYIDARPDKDNPPTFEPPANIVFLSVDQATGTIVPPDSGGGVYEAFIAGTQPGGLGR